MITVIGMFFHDPMTPFEVFLGAAISIALVLITGYCLTLGLFPKKEIDFLERIGLSIILGFTPFVLLYFFDKNFNIPINLVTSLIFFLLTSMIGLILWKYRIKN